MSEYPWTIVFSQGLSLQFMIVDATGEIVAISEFYDEEDLIASLRVFMRNPEIRLNAESLEKLRDRRKREFIQRELLLESENVSPRATRRKVKRADAGTDQDG